MRIQDPELQMLALPSQAQDFGSTPPPEEPGPQAPRPLVPAPPEASRYLSPVVESSPGCLHVDPQGDGYIQAIQLLGAAHHQAVLSYLQCQPLGSILVMRYSQPTSLALGSYVHKVLAYMVVASIPSTNGEKTKEQ